MSVFEPHTTLTKMETTRARIVTPLGTMAFEAIVDGEPLPVAAAFVREGALELRRYEHAHGDVELLILPFAPRLPDGMRVDGCVAAVWRASVKEDVAELAFHATWAPGAYGEDGGYDGGQHLMALTWYAPGAMLSLGTSDEEALAWASEEGLLPARLGPTILAHDGGLTRAVNERDGLEVTLPPLRSGDSSQVHMVLAWRTDGPKDEDASTWYAVNASPIEIARMADEALG